MMVCQATVQIIYKQRTKQIKVHFKTQMYIKKVQETVAKSKTSVHVYHIAGNFQGGNIFVVFVVGKKHELSNHMRMRTASFLHP